MLSPPSPHFGGCPAARQLCSPPVPPCPPPAPPPSILLARCLSQHAGAAWGPTFLLRLGFESAHSLGAPMLHCQVGGGYSFCGWGGGREGADGSCVSPYAIPMGPVGQLRTAQLVAPGRCCHPTLGDAASCAGTAWLCLLLTPLSSALPSGRAALPCTPPLPKLGLGAAPHPSPPWGRIAAGLGGALILLYCYGTWGSALHTNVPPHPTNTHTLCGTAVTQLSGGVGGLSQPEVPPRSCLWGGGGLAWPAG